MHIIIIFIIISLIAAYLFRKELGQILFWYGVPYVPTSDLKIQKFLGFLEGEENKNFLDLWCGDGRVLQAVWKKYPHLAVFWIENSPYPYKLSLQRKQENNLNYTVYKKDFFTEDFSKYDVIYSYTIPYLMKKIWAKIQAECASGTKFYSNSFAIPWEIPKKKIETTKGRYIYLYVVEK